MSKKLYGLLLPVLAIMAFAAFGGVAQAAPHWYMCHNEGTESHKYLDKDCEEESASETGLYELLRLPETGAKTAVTGKGTLTLHQGTLEVTCDATFAGSIWNPANGGAGEDEITSFTNTNCKSNSPMCVTPAITALKLPWKTLLLAGAPIRDEIKGIEVDLTCEGVAVETFAGTLTPAIKNDSPTLAEFGAGSGELTGTGTAKPKATVTGSVSIEGPGGETIQAFNP